MVGAVYQGLTQPSFNGSFGLFSCPTGNCTFPMKYTTFGVCNQCANVIYDVKNEFINHTYRNFSNDTFPRTVLNSTFPEPDENEVYLWSSPSMSQPPFEYNDLSPVAALISHNSRTVNWTKFPNSLPYSYRLSEISGFNSLAYTRNTSCTTDWMTGGERHPDTDCLIPSRLPTAKSSVPTGQCSPMNPRTCLAVEDWNAITASSCMLSFCGRTYEASVMNGVFVENLVSVSNVTEIAAQPGQYCMRAVILLIQLRLEFPACSPTA